MGRWKRYSRAREEDKPILVSIGYAACHWCHVMERESFEDDDTARFMNEHFVNIKIDREERPDLDHIYMDAVQAITGSGGWPLNVFLTSDARPFYGGTYFPPRPLYNRSSWMEVLAGVSRTYKERRSEVEEQAGSLTRHVATAGSFGIDRKTGDEFSHRMSCARSGISCSRAPTGKKADSAGHRSFHRPFPSATFSIIIITIRTRRRLIRLV